MSDLMHSRRRRPFATRFAAPRAWAESILAGVFCLVLGGCSTYHVEVDKGFSGDTLTAIGAKSGIPIQVDGAVAGLRGAPLATAIVAAMPASIGDTAVRYVPCEAFSECAGNHVVWTFGPPAARPASAYPPELTVNLNWFGAYQPAPNLVVAKAALFQGGTVVASATGQVEADSTDDPAFKAMIATLSDEIFAAPGWIDIGWFD